MCGEEGYGGCLIAKPSGCDTGQDAEEIMWNRDAGPDMSHIG